MATLGMKIDQMHRDAKRDANRELGLTGWSKYGDLQLAYYPKSNRYAYFTANGTKVSRRQWELALMRTETRA